MHDFFRIDRGLALDSLISVPVLGSLISGFESEVLNHGSGALELEVRSLGWGSSFPFAFYLRITYRCLGWPRMANRIDDEASLEPERGGWRKRAYPNRADEAILCFERGDCR